MTEEEIAAAKAGMEKYDRWERRISIVYATAIASLVGALVGLFVHPAMAIGCFLVLMLCYPAMHLCMEQMTRSINKF